jgi:hypothetical protein
MTCQRWGANHLDEAVRKEWVQSLLDAVLDDTGDLN